MGLLGVHVYEHAVGGGPLAAMAGDGIAVIDMRVLPDVELHFLAGVQPNLKVAFGVNLLDCSELPVGNVLIPVRRGELHAITCRKVSFRFPVNTYAVQSVRVVGKLLAVIAFHGE